MISILLRILFLCVLWWAVLWLALPLEWLQGSLLSLVSIHAAPPLSIAGAWSLFKRAWRWRAARKERIAAEKEATEHKNQQDAAQDAQQKTLAYRRATLECRGVWAAVLKTPDWHDGKPEHVQFIEQDAKTLCGAGRAAASIQSLQQVFAAAWAQSEACAWLPMILAANDPNQPEWIWQAWEQTVKTIKQHPEQPNIRSLPGSGTLADRLITLFENDPDLPAALVLGMDSPLGNTYETNSIPRANAPGHAVLAVLVSRPMLSALRGGAKPAPESGNDPQMTPYWERAAPVEDSLWERIPMSLRFALLSACPPFAALRRAATVDLPEMKRNARVQRVRETVAEAFVNAASIGETEPLEPGWLVHDLHNVARFSALSAALHACDYELQAIAEASNIPNEFGNVGAARETLMLAVSLIRAAQLKKPVLLAGSAKEQITLGVSKAVEWINPTTRPKVPAPRFKRLITGDPCPQTGLWRCIQTDKMVRVFEGQNMPSVMYDKPATGLLNWLRGNKRAYSHMGSGIFAWGEDPNDTEE